MNRNVVGYFMAMIMALSLLAGCSGGNTEEDSYNRDTAAAGTRQGPGDSEAVDKESVDNGDETAVVSQQTATEELVTIDWYVDLPWWQWGGEEFGRDLTSQLIMEKTGVTINFIVPASEGGEQLSGMIASDTLPDVITLEGWWSSQARMLTYQMAQEDYIWAYNDLIEEYAPGMTEHIRQDVFNWYAEADGKTYLLPNYAYSEEDLEEGEQLIPNGCITIRQDLYEAIGSPDMSTPEGFLDACEKVKNEIGTYDGQDIIPIQLYEGVGNSVGWLSQYFATPFEDETGNYLYDFTEENFKESLAFLNKAYQRGLISEANFSDTRDLVNEKIAGGRVFCMITAPQDFTGQMQALYDMDDHAVYIPVVLHNSKGEHPVLQDIRGFGWLTTAVSKSTEYPAEIARLFDYLLSDEGQIDMCYGVEGVTFAYNEDGTIDFTEEYMEAMQNDDTRKYGLSAMNLLDNYAYRRRFDVTPADPKLLATLDTIIKLPMAQYSYDYSAVGMKSDPADPRKEAMDALSVRISNFRSTAIAELITAPDTGAFESRYENAVAELQDMGLGELIEYNNDGYQAAKEALGMEYGWPPHQK